MPQIILILIVGLIAGMAVGVQAPLASVIGKQVGILESAFIVHLVGALSALILLIALRGGNLGSWRDVPWYAYAAGGLGVLIISTLSFLIPRAGVATTFVVIVAGQLFIAAFIDHFGLLSAPVREFDFPRLVGLLVVFGGVWLTVR